jgi:hypothetical protein
LRRICEYNHGDHRVVVVAGVAGKADELVNVSGAEAAGPQAFDCRRFDAIDVANSKTEEGTPTTNCCDVPKIIYVLVICQLTLVASVSQSVQYDALGGE